VSDTLTAILITASLSISWVAFEEVLKARARRRGREEGLREWREYRKAQRDEWLKARSLERKP
jgi:hypothetical protein